MKKLSILCIAVLSFMACSKKEGNLTVTGKVKDLKKGTLYLQKIEDTSLINLDSVKVNGNSSFSFQTDIESPQVLYLYLNKVDNSSFDDRIMFFAEPGEMTVNTSLEKFESEVTVNGSLNHQKLLEYRKMMERFNSQNLDLIKTNLEAQQEGNQDLVEETQEKHDKLLKRRYLFTVNFALNHKDLELAPYLAISEVFDANIKYLDTIYTSLTPKVQDSKYGKSLEKFLKDRREAENQEEKI